MTFFIHKLFCLSNLDPSLYFSVRRREEEKDPTYSPHFEKSTESKLSKLSNTSKIDNLNQLLEATKFKYRAKK